MASDNAQHGLRAEHLLGTLIRRSTPWAGAAGALCVLTYLLLDGLSGALAALLGLALVAVFFGVDVAVLRLTKAALPVVTVSALLAEYVVKVLLLAAFLWSIATSTGVDMHATAVTVIVTTVAGAIAVIVSAIRVRSFYFDFPTE
jgi:ATP synthase protein I